MKKINIILGVLMLVSFAVSCKKELPAGGTAVQSMAGDWWVRLDNGDPAGPFGDSYYNLSTYNTAANKPDSMWVDDGNNAKSFWGVKGKVKIDVSGLTFTGSNVVNQYYQSTFSIANGKIIHNGTKGPSSGVKTDSIYFEIQFSDDPVPGTIHKVMGYKRTDWQQDDHYN